MTLIQNPLLKGSEINGTAASRGDGSADPKQDTRQQVKKYQRMLPPGTFECTIFARNVGAVSFNVHLRSARSSSRVKQVPASSPSRG